MNTLYHGYNKTGNLRITWHCGALAWLLLRWKTINVTYSEFMCVALGIRHAKRMRCTILLSVARPALRYFSTLSHKRRDFRGKKGFFWHKISVSTSYKTSHCKKNRAKYDLKCLRSCCKLPVILVMFQWNFEYSRQILIYRLILSLEATNSYHGSLPAYIQRVCQSIDGRWTNYWALPARRCKMSHFKW